MSLLMAFSLLGGLGLFLFGMKMMSESLENMAGDRMRRVLEMLTNKRLAAVGVGAGVTAVVQSSSATTVMVVGFVNAGLMTLLQATGVIMGANIGTTITAQLIAFKLSDIAPFILFVGMIMTMFLKKRRAIRLGEMILGFGMLFVGLALMSEAMAPLRENEAFRNFLVNFKSPVIGILIGAGRHRRYPKLVGIRRHPAGHGAHGSHRPRFGRLCGARTEYRHVRHGHSCRRRHQHEFKASGRHPPGLQFSRYAYLYDRAGNLSAHHPMDTVPVAGQRVQDRSPTSTRCSTYP